MPLAGSHRRLLSLAVTAICAGHVGSTAWGAEPDQTTTTAQAPAETNGASSASAALPAVTVSASKGSSLEQMDLSTSVLSRQQVERAPQASTDQIIKTIPGVYTPQTSAYALHPTSAIVSIRGFGNAYGTKTLVLVDGIPINDGFFRTIDWSLAPKDNIERVEVIRGGGATSLWGNLAMGGVINIVTREPQPGEKRIDVAYGTQNTRTASAAFTLLANDRLKIGVTANTFHTDGYIVTPAQYRNASDTVKTSAFSNDVAISAYLTPNARSKFYLQVYDHGKRENDWIQRGSHNEWDKYGVRSGAEFKLDDGSSLNAYAWLDRTSYGTQNTTQTGGYSLATPSLGYAYISQIESAPYTSGGGSVFWQKNIGPIHDLKVGMDYRYINVNDHSLLFNTAGLQTSVFDSHGNHQFLGLFAQGTWRAEAAPLDVTLGLRGDYWRASNGSVSGHTLTSTINQPMADSNQLSFNPRLGAKYYFDNGLDLRAAVYRDFSAPGMNQMYRGFVSGSSYSATNPNLVPETNVGEEIGFDFKRPLYNVSFTAFHNRVSNFIDFPSLCTTSASCASYLAGTGLSGITTYRQYRNVGKATFRGVELMGDLKATRTLRLSAGVTYTSAYLTQSNYPAAAPVNSQIGQVPRWVFTGGVEWQALPDLQITANVRAWPGYWYNTAHTTFNTGAAVLDLGLSYRINKAVELYGSIQNLGGRVYYDQGANGTSAEPRLAPPFAALVGMRFTL
jgi:outer membrane receptor protein involved in Fe transport